MFVRELPLLINQVLTWTVGPGFVVSVLRMDVTTPVTAHEWRAYLTEFSDWYLRDPQVIEDLDLTEEQLATRWLGREPATERMIAETEMRLGVPLPPSLRGFLLVSDGWGPVTEWTDKVLPCAEIDWFTSFHQDPEWVEDDPENEFATSLMVADGEDVILLDTSQVSKSGEYAAYVLTVKYGELGDPMGSFGEVVVQGRAEIEEGRERNA